MLAGRLRFDDVPVSAPLEIEKSIDSRHDGVSMEGNRSSDGVEKSIDSRHDGVSMEGNRSSGWAGGKSLEIENSTDLRHDGVSMEGNRSIHRTIGRGQGRRKL